MSIEADASNHRVTNAILGEQIKEVVRRLESIEKKLASMDDKLDTNRERIIKLESKSQNWDIANTLGVIGAAIVAYFTGQR